MFRKKRQKNGYVDIKALCDVQKGVEAAFCTTKKRSNQIDRDGFLPVIAVFAISERVSELTSYPYTYPAALQNSRRVSSTSASGVAAPEEAHGQMSRYEPVARVAAKNKPKRALLFSSCIKNDGANDVKEILGNEVAQKRLSEIMELRSRSPAYGPRVIVLHGTSGIGKRSCVQAACATHGMLLREIDVTDSGSVTSFVTRLGEELYPSTNQVLFLTGASSMEYESSLQVFEGIIALCGRNDVACNLLVASDSCEGALHRLLSRKNAAIERVFLNPVPFETARLVSWKGELNSYFPEQGEWGSDFRAVKLLRFLDVAPKSDIFVSRNRTCDVFSLVPEMLGGSRSLKPFFGCGMKDKKKKKKTVHQKEQFNRRLQGAEFTHLVNILLENYTKVLPLDFTCDLLMMTETLSDTDIMTKFSRACMSSLWQDEHTRHDVTTSMLMCAVQIPCWGKLLSGCTRSSAPQQVKERDMKGSRWLFKDPNLAGEPEPLLHDMLSLEF